MASIRVSYVEKKRDLGGPVIREEIEKSDEVRTTDSVIIHLIWPIEELDIRSMSL